MKKLLMFTYLLSAAACEAERADEMRRFCLQESSPLFSAPHPDAIRECMRYAPSSTNINDVRIECMRHGYLIDTCMVATSSAVSK